MAAVAPLTLEAALAIGWSNNPALQAAGSRVEAANASAGQAGLWANPELGLRAEEWPVGSGGGFSRAKQTVGLAQTVPFPGKKRMERQLGVFGTRLAESARNLRACALTRDIKRAFYEALAADGILEVAGGLAGVAESSAAAARKRVGAGAAPDQEELRAAIVLEQARAEVSQYGRDAAIARQQLAYLLGDPALATTPLAGELAETADGAADQPPADWLARHPEVIAARASLQQAELAARRARLEPYPDVKVEIAGGRLGDTGESIVELGLAVPLPIFDRAKGQQAEARANARAAASDQTAVEQRLLLEWRNAAHRVRAAAEQAALSRERILPKAEAALRLVQAGFEGGKFGFIDLIDTQRTAAEARLTYQQKLRELNLARADLEFLLNHQSQ